MQEENRNIAKLLTESALKYPDARAVVYPAGRDRCGRVTYSHLTFSQLERLSSAYASEFREAGIIKGTRALMMLRPGLDFIAAAFAAFKTGCVPILIDPGMGRKNLLKCIRDTAPEALIAVSELHWIAKLFPSSFRSVKIAFSSGKFPPPGVIRLEGTAKKVSAPRNSSLPFSFECEKVLPDDTAAILFTTGSTGPPKGVVYTHRIFMAQVRIIQETYGTGPHETDMAAFPLFALFSAAMGMTCVIPDMDPTRPAKVNPLRIIEAVRNQGVTFSFGSPALWRAVAAYCIENKIKLPSLRKVLMAGAPVTAELHAMLKQIIAEDGETLVPYGATESLPAASFTGSEMLRETAEKTREGEGYCVGYPVNGVTVKVIKNTDGAIPEWAESLVLPNGERGEIVIKGDIVTPSYYRMEAHTEMAKIRDADGKLWHRIGDMGYFDEKGRLWFCGRKSHLVKTANRAYYTVCSEAIFNRHPDVFRSALVGADGKAVLVIEPKPGKMPASKDERERFVSELLKLGKTKEFTADIRDFLFHESFPVDIRHNAKIFREKLAEWAEKTL
ncbi:MAG: hypothetical protein A2017_19430 [Lentisphaerae bacterium GWF2_44_16]|nr:MAG: hypothetical protein A2017_19430 [Lentisphaerae bacterium GWF2_44_16]